jgi:archaea-specific DNA-binding protein
MAEKNSTKTKLTESKVKTTKAKETQIKETKLKPVEVKEPKSKEIKSKSVEVKEENQVAEDEVLHQEAQGNFVYIGKKEAMAYVLAVSTRFEMGAKEVIIKARGKSISRAVDVAEISRAKDVKIKLASINIATEEVVTQEGRPLKISSIEIILTR